MSENEFAGASQTAFGRAEGAFGEAIGSTDLETDGASNKAKGRTKKAAAKVQDAIDATADKVSAGVAKVSEQGRVAYDRAAQGVQRVAAKVDPLVTERPYAAMGVGMAVGVLLGLVLAHGRGAGSRSDRAGSLNCDRPVSRPPR